MSVRLGGLDPGHGHQARVHQFVAYAADWEPVPEDGLPWYPERLAAGVGLVVARDDAHDLDRLARAGLGMHDVAMRHAADDQAPASASPTKIAGSLVPSSRSIQTF